MTVGTWSGFQPPRPCQRLYTSTKLCKERKDSNLQSDGGMFLKI